MKTNYKFGGALLLTLSLGLASTNGYGQLYDFESHTFTNAGALGKNGPTLAACQTAYTAEVWELDPTLFNMDTQGIQEWTVPVTGTYEIEAAGAQGGNDLFTSNPEDGGLGARMVGTFDLVEGQVLYILVGQKGEDTRVTSQDNAAAGGGGGSFVWDPTDDALPLLAAGAGAGGSGFGYSERNGTDGEDGQNAFSVVNGGIGGNGGQPNTIGSSYWAGGGAGWLTNGTAGNFATAYVYDGGSYAEGGRRPLEGGIGGTRFNDGSDEGGDGGFGGGGGGGSDNMGTGGGGGYSGGGGQNGDAFPSMNSGGGGGSYNGGSDQTNTAAINAGDGYVTITLLCNVIAVEAYEDILCIGEEIILNGTAESGEAVTWDLGVINGESFAPPVGTTVYTGSTDNIDDCIFQASITVNALPDVTVEVDDADVCAGESVIFSSDGATTYSWDPADITGGDPYTPATGTSTYTVTGTDDNGCENSASIDVTVYELPDVIATADEDAICIGDEIVLSGEGATTYVWDPADVTDGDSYTPSTTGTLTFNVEGTDDNGCINDASIDIEVNDLPVVTASVDSDIICQGSSVIFNGGGADSYDWDMGVTDNEAFTPAATGTETYTVTGTDVNGCENIASIDVEVTENTIEINGVMTPETAGADGEIDITVTGGTPGYTFDWDNDETGDFDDTEDLTGLVANTYTVVVMDSEGCIKESVFELVNQVGITELNAALVQVYPNPTNADLNIQLEGQFNYTIYNTVGEIVSNGSATDNETVFMQSFADGVYFVQINADNKTITLKVVKK